jgi:mono/diheme cytochrome c family protein
MFVGTLISSLPLMVVLTEIPRHGVDLQAAERGKQILLGTAFNPPAWSAAAYRSALSERGASKINTTDSTKAFMDRYGLHPAPYSNGEYPMGLRSATGILKGVTTDCLLCHGGSILGQSYVGLGNSSLDIQALFEELAVADGRSPQLPFTFSNVRGTNEAGAMAVFLLSWRDPDLRLRKTSLDLGLRDDLCEDVPAWWLLKKKKTMYYTGGSDARSVRALMQFMLGPLTTASAFARHEPSFADIQAYILSLESPKYPFPVDDSLARQGEKIFLSTCARCHGTYGGNWTYPNKIVPLNVIGTDPNRYRGISFAADSHFTRSWFGHEKRGWFADDFAARPATGYQAPPLDGIWATAPYLHNGSVPTVYHVLNSKARPSRYTRTFRTDLDSYDTVKLGWRFETLGSEEKPQLTPYERRKIYDTRLPGRGNSGHTFGDDLTETERWAVIEYLKTL